LIREEGKEVMRKLGSAVIGAAVLAGAAGCDGVVSGKFELVHAGNQTYLLNKSTGEAKLVTGARLVAVVPGDEGKDATFQKTKTWADETVGDLKDVKFSIRTKHRDGEMMYIVTGGPFAGPLERAWNAASLLDGSRPSVIFFDLIDEEGFKVGEPIEIRMRDGTRTVDEKGVVSEMRWTGSKTMTVETYREAKSVGTRWSGLPKD
jgi:hypothetical protein